MPISIRDLVDQGSMFPIFWPPVETTPALSDRLLILACSARKDPSPGKMPAIARYQGPLWQSLRKADPNGERCQVAFLSAYYGGPWCARSSRIANYDCRLSSEQSADWIKRGTRRATTYSRATTDAGKALEGASGLFQMAQRAAPARRFREVCLVGGGDYIAVMRAELARAESCLDASATVSVINGSIGTMRRDLADWVL